MNETEQQKGNAKLLRFAEKGYRYYSWVWDPPKPWERKDIQDLKFRKSIDDVRTFAYDGRRIVIVKENELAYIEEFEGFVNLLKKSNLRRKLVKNLGAKEL